MRAKILNVSKNNIQQHRIATDDDDDVVVISNIKIITRPELDFTHQHIYSSLEEIKEKALHLRHVKDDVKNNKHPKIKCADFSRCARCAGLSLLRDQHATKFCDCVDRRS